MTRFLILQTLSLLAFAGAGVSAQTVKEDTRLLDKPLGSPQGAVLVTGSSLKVLERQGFWLRVEASGRIGWTKASAVSFSSAPSGPTAIETGRMGTNNIVASSAARGLSAKDLMNGLPRVDEVEKLAQYAIGDLAEVSAFMAQGAVTPHAQRIVLKVPAAKTTTTSAGANPAGTTDTATKVQGKRNDNDW
jgi:hypothetical protein